MLIKRKVGFWGVSALVTIAVILGIKNDGMGPIELHQFYLNNSPYKDTKHLNKLDRFEQGLPPDRFNEEIYDLTMDPSTGVPNYSSKLQVQQQLKERSRFRVGAVPGQDTATPWYTIGPNNEAGRTRAALFDLADTADYNRVIAGGVSGGLWINNDITDASQAWTQVNIPGNLAVSNIIQDPSNTNVMYVGTGESYTSGDVTGNGIYKSINGGSSWTQIFGSTSGAVTSTFDTGYNIYEVEGYFYVNDLVIWDHDENPATDEYLFAALGYSSHSKMADTYLDFYEYGLYRSTDGGTNWSKINVLNSGTNQNEHINDMDVQVVSNRLWLSTTSSNFNDGGNFYYSDDGSTFTRATPTWDNTPVGIARTEIAPSATDTDTHYIIASVGNKANLYKTVDNFATITTLNEPQDDEVGMPADDFTRGQSFYDLEIEVDPTNDDIVYAGGINWHRSDDGGTTWEQITKWNNISSWFPNVTNISVTHADQHGLYFRPNDSDQAVVVNDGGVAYSSSLSQATNTITFSDREDNFITTQFYRVAQTPDDFAGTDLVFGGTQDNGTYQLSNPGQSLTGASVVTSGDGAATFFDQEGGSYMISNYIYNNSITRFDYDASGNRLPGFGTDLSAADQLNLPSNEGSFINPAALDSYNDVYFSNGGNQDRTVNPAVAKNAYARVITDLDGTPSTFTIENVGTNTDYITALEVSRHTTNTTTLFIGLRSGELKKITNAGTSGGASISSVHNQVGSISDIHIGESEDDIYLTYYNYGINGNIQYSSDGGTSFSNKEGNLPDIPVFSILHNPYEEDEVIVGTELGVWKTDNFTSASPNWTVADEGMSDVAVFDMVFRGPTAVNNRVVAATYGRGIYVGSFSANSNIPVTNTDSITLAEGGTATTTTAGATSVLTNDTDLDRDALTADFTQGPVNSAGAGWAYSSTGSFTYTHDGSETNTDTFFYRAFDGTNYGDTVTVTINITPVNDCPSVDNPIADFTVMEDDPDTVLDLSNTFGDVDNISINITNVANANTALLTATLNTNTLTLDYIDNQTGMATITIDVSDGSCTEQEIFVVTVVPQNDAPVGSPDVINVAEGGTATTTTANNSSVLTDDTDTENDPLTATLVPGSGPLHHLGSFSLSSSGTFTYIHDGSETTTDTFEYTLSDGLSSVTVSVTINITPVNDCPVAATPTLDITVDEDDPNTVLNFNTVFTDADILPVPNMLSYTVTHTNASLATLTFNTATLTIDYKDDQNGSMVVTVTADDNASCNTTTDVFNITVNSVNDIPNTVTDTIQVDEGGTATTTTANSSSVLDNDSDVDGPNPINMEIVSMPQFGTLAWSGTGTFTYIHDSSETTTDSFSYRTYDGQDRGNTVVVSINIMPINDCPQNTVFRNSTINEDSGAIGYPIASSDTTDPDNAYPLASYTVTYTNASLATVTFDPTLGDPSFAPKLNQNGTMTGTVTISDGDPSCTLEVPFQLTVVPRNDAPNTVTDTIQVDEGGTATTTTANSSSVLDNDSDVDGPNPINMEIVSMPQFGTLAWSGTGTFTYIHDSSETTTDSFSYRTYDGQDRGNTVVVSINIMPINDCPQNTVFRNSTINEDSGAIGYPIASSDTTDPDNAYPLASYTVTYTNASLATVTFDPTLGDPSFAPKLNQNGTMTGTVTISDGDPSCTLEVPFQLTVVSINDCPTLDNPITDVSVNEDAADQWIDIQNTFSDVESTTLNYTVSSNDPSIVAASLTSTSIILDFQDNAYGNATIIITVTDGDINCTIDDLFDVTIAGINDGPTTNPESLSVISGNTVTTLNDGVTTSVLDNDTDPEGDAITSDLVTTTLNGILILNANGTFSYTHDGSATSTDTFYYRATDGYVPGNTVSVTIYINNPPVAVTETIAVMEGGTATTTTNGSTSVLSNDTDTDAGDPLTAVLVTNPTEGTLTLNPNGTFSYVHGGGNLASDSFTYSANDGKINGAPVTVSITVTGTNDPPVANDDNIIVPLNGTITTLDNDQTSLTANDIDPDGDVLTASLVNTPTFGTITLNPGGTFSYTQNGTLNGGDSFIYSVSDGTLTSSATVNILLSCSPCTESIIEGGVNGVSFSYTDCLCKTVRVYVPKGKAYTFCHLDNSISVNSGNYTLITSKVCN
jgi:VCBS repeat-containing protein